MKWVDGSNTSLWKRIADADADADGNDKDDEKK